MIVGLKPSRSDLITTGATAYTKSLYRWLKTNRRSLRYAFGTNDMLSTMPPTPLAFYNTRAVFAANSGRVPGCVGFEYHDTGWTSRYGSEATDATRAAIQAAYAQGSIILLHHHSGNPVTGSLSAEGTLSTFNNPFGQIGDTGNVYDRNSTPLTAVNTGGAQEAQFLAYLDRLATFLASLVDGQGRLIPVIFRPMHECNANSFWWGGSDRSTTFKAVWQKMVTYLRDTKGVSNVLYCWNVDIGGDATFSTYFPGATFVDIVSLDIYDNAADGSASLDRGGTTPAAYNALTALATTHDKPVILAELGYTTGASTVSDIWDVKTGRPMVNSYRQFALAAVWRSPFGPGSGDSTAIKTSLSNMASSPYALTAERLTGVFK